MHVEIQLSDCLGAHFTKALHDEPFSSQLFLLQMEVEIDKIEQAEQTEAVPTLEAGMQESAAAEDATEGAQAQKGSGGFSGCLAGRLGDSTTSGCVVSCWTWLQEQSYC